VPTDVPTDVPPGPRAKQLPARELALLAERLRARDAQVALAALAEVARLGARELTAVVAAQLSPARLQKAPDVVIEALKVLGALGATAELARAERALPAGYHGWIAVARQALPPR
jgi:hypothetical protein